MLTISQVTKTFSARTLFSDVSLQVNRGNRIGLIGPNGAGKSTLFSLILGQDSPDEGTIVLQRNARVGYLPQESMPAGKETILELALLGGPANSSAAEIADDLDHQREAKAKRILSGLAFRERDFTRPACEFSGGWIIRGHLARLLVAEPDLLLLDEPTNHLDLQSVGWLQNYLREYAGAIVLVSHDRAFLNAIVRKIVEFDRGKLLHYQGDYEGYLAQRTARRDQQLAAFKNQQREIAKLQTFIDRFGAKNTKAAQAQSKRKQIERMEKVEAPEPEIASVHFRFPQPARSGARVLELKQLQHAYGEQLVYRALNVTIERGQKTVLVGPNGAGKSTLLKLLAGVLSVQKGERTLGYNVELGYFSQHRAEMFDLRRTVLAEVSDIPKPPGEQIVRSVLGAFLFRGDDVFKPVAVLSGGEKSRLALAKLLLTPPNLLLMDEPTTHLDMCSIEALVGALRQYQGTLLFISHDAYFIRQIATSVFQVQDGAVTLFPGDYDYYLDKSARDAAGQRSTTNESERQRTSAETRESGKERKRREAEERQAKHQFRQELRSRLSEVERRIVALERRQNELVSALESQNEESSGATAGLELKRVADELSQLLPEWERLAEQSGGKGENAGNAGNGES
ncbi:MAG TPA: ABC-F family ATP-binding cassette domain-containing protein [Chthoniobacterales bacterium]|nr:ABC-F family ATP-binding cassette domain-containing protein [Chthoniobacterales bacterium]